MTISSTVPGVVTYAASNGAGINYLLFNLSSNSSHTVTLAANNLQRSSFSATQYTYGKAQYDESVNNVWTGYTTSSLGIVNSASFSVTLPPWSMSVVTLQ